ncbi:uncharacterized protein KD926_000764 [Aspergillus affinis]|uniref:uncharacterized protein n=1 Tax=Aspergillus affinis TaxID=1070780 RepID=UPI0022FEF886|nr:uncharacterized protein KD926_000764 [Aspergillus affinis]KAI9037191.1 hypothetical protein KD926_000764 [Aspergillus affinis]
MFQGSAITLAQEGGYFDSDQRSCASAPSPAKETLRQQWSRLLCVFIYLAEEHLTMRLGLGSLVPEGPAQTVRNRLSTMFSSLLPDSAIWDSYYGLFTETKKARVWVQSLRKTGGPNAVDEHILPELEHIDRALSRWRRQHVSLKSCKFSLLSMCMDLEYHYSVMYSFALASYILHNMSAEDLNEQKRASLLQLISRESQASHIMLSMTVNKIGRSRMMRYLPVRCWLFIVAAGLHLLKLVLNASLHSSYAGVVADSNIAVAAAEASLNAAYPPGCLPTPALGDLSLLDFPTGLINPGDPFQWWEIGGFGTMGGPRI